MAEEKWIPVSDLMEKQVLTHWWMALEGGRRPLLHSSIQVE